MILTALLLTLKLMTVFVEPEVWFNKDDISLATCAVHALTAQPNLTIATTKDRADVTLVVGNRAKWRLHVVGKLVDKDGTVLLEVDHMPPRFDFNHGLCHQMDGLLDEMTKKFAAKQAARH